MVSLKILSGTSTAPCKGILLESETLSFAEQGYSCPSEMTTFLLASQNRSPKRASSSCTLADSASFTPSPSLLAVGHDFPVLLIRGFSGICFKKKI